MPQPPASPNDDEVLTFEQWIRLNKISPATGWRILRSPDGPKLIQLSQRRIGITRRADREWKRSREVKRIARQAPNRKTS